METLKNIIFLIIAVVIAFLGLKFSLYGLIVNIIDPSLNEISISEIYSGDLVKKRYISVKDAASISYPLEYLDENGNTQSYLYPLFQKISEDSINIQKVKILVESPDQINNWENAEITGLLKPYWHKIDKNVIRAFASTGIEVDRNAYYLPLGSQPYKWYWYLIILGIASLFFYRMIEAFIKRLKKRTASNTTYTQS